MQTNKLLTYSSDTKDVLKFVVQCYRLCPQPGTGVIFEFFDTSESI